jgi:hypothetical protein
MMLIIVYGIVLFCHNCFLTSLIPTLRCLPKDQINLHILKLKKDGTGVYYTQRERERGKDKRTD